MTRVIELRRHSRRNGADANLSQAGVDLARRLGAEMGPFALVLTSPAERAIQTAVAMGFALDRIEDALALPGLSQLALELDTCKTFADVIRLMRASVHMAEYARTLRMLADELAGELRDGERALAISHGGVLETLVAACLDSGDADDDARIRALGDGFRFCEGARLIAEAGNRYRLDALLRVERG
jgi:broad specificity phosphatase PhoE